MTREEILERIRIGEEYLERDNLTPKQRKQAEERYSDLVARLSEMSEPAAPKEPEQLKTADPNVLACMNKIRAILDMPLRQESAE